MERKKEVSRRKCEQQLGLTALAKSTQKAAFPY
jgi:hypothetical protein